MEKFCRIQISLIFRGLAQIQKKNNKPKGYEIFTKGLSEINLPEELIRDPERLQLFKTYGCEKTPDRGKGRKSVQKDSPEPPRPRKDQSDYSGRLTFKKHW